MKIKIIGLLLITTILIVACQSSKEEREIPILTFDIPYLLKLEKDELIKELGAPQYKRTDKEFFTKTKFGDIIIPSKTETLIYNKNGYSLSLSFIQEKLKYPIKIYFCNEDAKKVDSIGLQKIKIAGNIIDESKYPSSVTIEKTSNGFAIYNFADNFVKPTN